MSSIADVYTMQEKRGGGTPESVTVTSLATLLAAENPKRVAILMQNLGSVDVYLGDSNVTIATGIRLAAGQTYSDNHTVRAWYGITASATADVRVLILL